MGGRFASEEEISLAEMDPQIFTNLVALQRHVAEHLIAYRVEIARQLREEADSYELRALSLDYLEARELTWIALGLRAAAVKVDPE